ncbi:P-loop containing nucleoside triphosphate hydrolase protein [Mycena galopus ATCC 62051]|nr:P-loop containing nucleoside triphosphate hydrolase protein [Mycena galopus ATCC 62051]
MRHQELLELISSQSSPGETISSIGQSSLNVSSGSFSLLPASPKIFHGRESELEELVEILMTDPVRVAVLGPGGMGKTTLAMAALHHPKVSYKYQTRHFISCESVHTWDSLVAVIVSHLGLDTSSISERAVLALLSAGQPCLMVLDNFETPWEALGGRAKVEAFLALLADIPHVALLLTMRGTERPGKVQWTHPFIRPLMPLDQAAARQTFIEIADEIHDSSEVDQLLEITDNIPLAVQLVAGVAASVGCQETLEQWNIERTALLSAGYDKRSNLDISIRISVSSPRMLSSPHAVQLLSLMSLLSDGISNFDLVKSNIPIPDIPNCKTTLIRTSLAYIDHAGRIKVLAPIREYIQATRPPSRELVQPVRKYLIDLFKIYAALWHGSTFVVDLVPRLLSNLGNLHSVLQQGLDYDHTDLRESVLGILLLNELNLMMNRGLSPLMLRLPEILSGVDDQDIYGQFITATLESRHFHILLYPELATEKAIEHFHLTQNHDREVCFSSTL